MPNFISSSSNTCHLSQHISVLSMLFLSSRKLWPSARKHTQIFVVVKTEMQFRGMFVRRARKKIHWRRKSPSWKWDPVNPGHSSHDRNFLTTLFAIKKFWLWMCAAQWEICIGPLLSDRPLDSRFTPLISENLYLISSQFHYTSRRSVPYPNLLKVKRLNCQKLCFCKLGTVVVSIQPENTVSLGS